MPKRPGRVIVLGSINRDLVLRVAAHPRPGETVSGADVAEYPGGKGANQAVAAARAGAATRLIGATGDDGFGAAMRAFLASEGIDLSGVRMVHDRPTGIAAITVDRSGENMIVVSPGANAALGAADAAGLEIAADDVVIAQFEVPEALIRAGFARARSVGARTLLNPAPMRTIAPELRALTDILVVNETELAQATGSDAADDLSALRRAAQNLAARPEDVVVVTLGKAGAIAISAGGFVRIEGIAAKAVDTTGAGDCFVGVLAAGLAEGLALEPALARANRAAAISVTRPGAASSMPKRAEFVDG